MVKFCVKLGKKSRENLACSAKSKNGSPDLFLISVLRG